MNVAKRRILRINVQQAGVAGFAAEYSGARYREADVVSGGLLPATQRPFSNSDTTTTVQDRLAAFGEVAEEFGPHWVVRGGVRVEREDYDAVSTTTAFHAQAVETLIIPKLSVSYQDAEQRQFYATIAKGYAPGGVDAALPTCFLPPTPYPTDTLWSFEFGAKSSLLDGRAHLAGSVFHAQWNNGPTVTGNCLFTHLPGGAESNGFDIDSEAHFLDDRLRAQDAMHSANPGPFYTADPTSFKYAPGLAADPTTNVLNLRATLALRPLSDSGDFDVAVYLDNALDSQPTLLKRNKGDDLSTLYYAATFRPRTLGLSGTWRF